MMSHQETVLGSDCLNSTAARFIINRGSSVTKFLATFSMTVGLMENLMYFLDQICQIDIVNKNLPRDDL